jgi:hypothetical protein
MPGTRSACPQAASRVSSLQKQYQFLIEPFRNLYTQSASPRFHESLDINISVIREAGTSEVLLGESDPNEMIVMIRIPPKNSV